MLFSNPYPVVRLVASISVLICSVSPAYAEPMQVYIVESYGGAALIPSIRQQLAAGGSISHYQNKLIIRTTPSNYRQINQLLVRIDTMPKNLNLQLRLAGDGQSVYEQHQGVVTANRNGVIVHGTLGKKTTWTKQQAVYRVNTLNASQASISTGTLLNLATSYWGGWVASIVPVEQGFSVQPTLLPNGKVRLNLQVKNNQISSVNSGENIQQPISIQTLKNQLIISPNQWVQVGYMSLNNSQDNAYHSRHYQQTLPIEIQVTVD